MRSWDQLDVYLGTLTRRLGGTAYIFSDSGKLQLSPPGDREAELIERFERAVETVQGVFGRDCLRNGHWKRHFHHEADNWFVAEPVMSAYHLIVIFDAEYESDDWLKHVLDRARPILAGIITGLPPLDGGRRAVAIERDP